MLDVSVGEHGGPRHVWSFHVPINASRSALWLQRDSSLLLSRKIHKYKTTKNTQIYTNIQMHKFPTMPHVQPNTLNIIGLVCKNILL